MSKSLIVKMFHLFFHIVSTSNLQLQRIMQLNHFIKVIGKQEKLYRLYYADY